MQQRRLRLGDILDDYCPRERRITNHAVVAMIDDEVKQTRCTTCDAEHEYKQAKVPPARRKKLEGASLGDAAEGLLRRPSPESEADLETEAPSAPEQEPNAAEDVPMPLAAAAEAPSEPEAAPEPPPAGDEEGPVHRRLIRATLPRPEGQVPERKLPDFTIRQPGRGGREFDGNKNGQRHGRRGGGMRFGGARQGGGSGQGPRHGSGQGQGPRHGSGPGQRQGGGNRRGGGRKRGR